MAFIDALTTRVLAVGVQEACRIIRHHIEVQQNIIPIQTRWPHRMDRYVQPGAGVVTPERAYTPQHHVARDPATTRDQRQFKLGVYGVDVNIEPSDTTLPAPRGPNGEYSKAQIAKIMFAPVY